MADPLLSDRARRMLGAVATFLLEVAFLAGFHALIYEIFGNAGSDTVAAHLLWGFFMASIFRIGALAQRRWKARRSAKAGEGADEGGRVRERA